MNSQVFELVVAVSCSILASSGFWALIQHFLNRNDSSKKLLLGLAHDRIMFLGTHYIDRGYITPDEFENLTTYLYEPYTECGGNGSAKHIVDMVKTLEVRK